MMKFIWSSLLRRTCQVSARFLHRRLRFFSERALIDRLDHGATSGICC
jgi:hypothetical protein